MILKEYNFILYQLLRPLSYLSIKHEDKWIYDWLIPLILTVFSVWLCYLYVPLENIRGDSGLISKVTDFVSSLPGFFIAALAVVATFDKHDIDKIMDNPPKIRVLYQGRPLMVDMTRRRFLCVLFSYLTAISIFLVLGARFGLNVTVSNEYLAILSWTGISIFLFVLWQMLIATILGLFYLGERLHIPQ